MIALGLITCEWTVFAVFCGLGWAVASDKWRPAEQRLLPRLAVFLILGSTGLFVFFHDLMSRLGVFALPLNVLALGLIFASTAVYLSADDRRGRLFRAVGLLAAAFAFLGFFSCQFFLPLMFFPASAVVPAFLVFTLVFSAIVAVAFRANWVPVDSQGAANQAPQITSPTSSPLRWGFWPVAAVTFVGLIYVSPPLQTWRILNQRRHTMEVFRATSSLALAVRSESEGGEGSVYPADLGITKVSAYLTYLLAHHVIDRPLGVAPSELLIANVSAKDPATTIFVCSKQDQLDIHTMINTDGVPHYAHGFILIHKDGKGQFYRNEMAESPKLGVEPPRSPQYLAP